MSQIRLYRYALAAAAVALAGVLNWALWGYIRPQVSPLFFAAVMVSAWYGGLGAGLVATALAGFASVYFFSEPRFSLAVDFADLLRFGVFLGVAVLISALTEARRRVEGELRLAQSGLEQRISDRTRELAATNQALEQEVGERRRAQEGLIEHQTRLRQLAAEVVLAEQRERRRIAVQLHDEIGQTLSASQILLGGLRRADSNAEDQALDQVERLLESAIARTRAITCELSPPVLYELGLEAALGWLCDGFRRKTGVPVEFRPDRLAAEPAEDVSLTIFHVVRELLANVGKHARAGHVKVTLHSTGHSIETVVEDDGIGFDPTSLATRAGANSFGLFSVKERVGHRGGSLNIESAPGSGSRVHVRIPLPEPRGDA